MIKLQITLLSFIFSISLFAQLPDGVVAPNFTATDLKGDVYTLYDVLDEGKTVILDVSATWCGPCWNFHHSGVLEGIWDQYGPEGSDEIFVFFIEADGSTSIDDLYGTGNNTIGDWVTGVKYPIIDRPQINSLYNINFFPTLYQICADRTLHQLSQVYDIDGFYSSLRGCAQMEGDNNIVIRDFNEFSGASCGEVEFTPEFNIQNMGSQDITSANIDVFINGELEESIPWTGNLASYQIDDVKLNSITTDESIALNVIISDVNGQPDDVSANNEYTYKLQLPKIADNKATLKIKTDNYGDELYWIIYSPTGQIVGKGGNDAVGLGNNGVGTHTAPDNPNSYASNTEINVDLDLEQEGCYFLLISDYYGDGLCCNEGDGSFAIYDSNDELVMDVTEIGESFNTQFERLFFSSTNDVVSNTELKILPNPNNGEFNLELTVNTSDDYKLTITDLTGKTVYDLSELNMHSGTNKIQLDTDLNNGIYLLTVESNSEKTSQKIIIQN